MSADGPSLKHDAFMYGSDEELVEAMVPFVREGLAQGHAVLAIVSPGNIDQLRAALGSDASRVHWFDRAAFYVPPAVAIADLDAVIWELTSAGVPLVRLLDELPFGSTSDEQAAWTRYEAIVNRVFDRSPLWAVCLYDTRILPHRWSRMRTALTGRSGRAAGAGRARPSPTRRTCSGRSRNPPGPRSASRTCD
jgi:MEDS: MEthanogen/methylotroph, DcmR Sensory domain